MRTLKIVMAVFMDALMSLIENLYVDLDVEMWAKKLQFQSI